MLKKQKGKKDVVSPSKVPRKAGKKAVVSPFKDPRKVEKKAIVSPFKARLTSVSFTLFSVTAPGGTLLQVGEPRGLVP